MKSVVLSLFCIIERNGFSEVERVVSGTKLGVFPFDTAEKTKALMICICIQTQAGMMCVSIIGIMANRGLLIYPC